MYVSHDLRWPMVAAVLLIAGGCAPGTGSDAGTGTDATTDSSLPSDSSVVTALCPDGQPMDDLFGKPIFDVVIDGLGPLPFVWDTGAPSSVMDDDVRAMLGDPPWDFTIGDEDIQVAWMYSTDVNAFLNSSTVAGVIGTDVMRNFIVTVDPLRNVYWLDTERDEAALLACTHVDGDPVDVVYLEQDYLFVPGKVEDLEGWMLVDTGASLGATPDPHFDALQATAPRPVLDGFYTPAAIGTFWARLATLGSMEVAGKRIDRILTRTLPGDLLPSPVTPDGGPMLGVLPTRYLEHFMLTVDYPAGTLRMDGYAGMPAEEPALFFPVGIGLAESVSPPVLVAQVLPGSAAEEAGVAVGDEVVAVNGWDMASLSPLDRPFCASGHHRRRDPQRDHPQRWRRPGPGAGVSRSPRPARQLIARARHIAERTTASVAAHRIVRILMGNAGTRVRLRAWRAGSLGHSVEDGGWEVLRRTNPDRPGDDLLENVRRPAAGEHEPRRQGAPPQRLHFGPGERILVVHPDPGDSAALGCESRPAASTS